MSDPPPYRADLFTAARSGDGDVTNGGSRSRGVRHESERGAASDDYDNEGSKADSDSARRGPLSSVSERPKGHATNQKEVGCRLPAIEKRQQSGLIIVCVLPLFIA